MQITGDKMLGISDFYDVELHKDELKLTRNILLNRRVRPILWMNNGLYGLVPKEKVSNAVKYLEAQHKLHPMSPYPIYWIFYWDEVIHVPPKIGKQLVEKFD